MFQQKENGDSGSPPTTHACTLSFTLLISHYQKVQRNVQSLVRKIASCVSQATPGRFLLVQFAMAQVTQLGDTISNLISQINSMISTAVRNQKTS